MNTPTHYPAPGEIVQCCGNCTHWTRHSDERMSYYGECARREPGRYSVEQSECLFDPSRWAKK